MKSNTLCDAFLISFSVAIGFLSGVGVFLGTTELVFNTFTLLLNAF